MKIKGKYIREVTKFRDCIIYLERGNIYEVSIPDASPLVTSSYVPKNKSQFTLERLPKFKKGLIPYDSNYVLEFIGKGGNQNRIYLKLNLIKTFQAKWVLRQYLIQSKDMKTDIIKYIIGLAIGGAIGLLFGFVGDNLFEKKTDRNFEKNNKLQDKTMKSIKTKDTIRIDSISKFQ